MRARVFRMRLSTFEYMALIITTGRLWATMVAARHSGESEFQERASDRLMDVLRVSYGVNGSCSSSLNSGFNSMSSPKVM
ncbi:hypothetical protein D3C86_1915810 [compost metagenome]